VILFYSKKEKFGSTVIFLCYFASYCFENFTTAVSL